MKYSRWYTMKLLPYIYRLYLLDFVFWDISAEIKNKATNMLYQNQFLFCTCKF